MRRPWQKPLLKKLARVRGQDKEWAETLKSIDRGLADTLEPAHWLSGIIFAIGAHPESF